MDEKNMQEILAKAIVLISAAFEKLFLLLVDKIAERMGA